MLALGVYQARPVAASSATSAAQNGATHQVDTPSTQPDGDRGGDLGILPRPNSGSTPKSSSDRGGWEQYAVMGSIVAALGAIVLLIRRESKRAKVRFEQKHAND